MYYGDWEVGKTDINWLFNTDVNGVLTTLLGSPAVSVYKNSMTERAEASALSVDYDGVVGLNQILIDTSVSGSFYAADNHFHVVLTAGTVGGTSAVGVCVGSFSLSKRTTNLNKTTKAIGRGTVTSGGSTTSVPTSAFLPAGAAVDQFKNRSIVFDDDTTTTALRGQVAKITGSTNASTPTFTVTTLTTAPSSGDTFSVV